MPSPQSVWCLGGVGGTMYAMHFLLAVSVSTVSGALASIHQGIKVFVCYLWFLHIHVPESLTKGTSCIIPLSLTAVSCIIHSPCVMEHKVGCSRKERHRRWPHLPPRPSLQDCSSVPCQRCHLFIRVSTSLLPSLLRVRNLFVVPHPPVAFSWHAVPVLNVYRLTTMQQGSTHTHTLTTAQMEQKHCSVVYFMSAHTYTNQHNT